MRKSQKIIWAQWIDRNKPTLAPETSYCLPDSRFALLMRLVRMGASDKLIRRKIPGIDGVTIMVAHKIVDGTISGGRRFCPDEYEEGQAAG